MPNNIVYKKLEIMWLIKNANKLLNKDKIGNKRNCRAYEASVNYVKTSFVQKFLAYSGRYVLIPWNWKLR